MEMLVGYTGFVGSNLAKSHSFEQLINSKNVETAFGSQPDLCVYAGIRAEKFLANQNPLQDRAHIEDAIHNLELIRPKRLVLISTIDVFQNPNGVSETAPVDMQNLHPYGYNRYLLENWVRHHIEAYHIVRLPGLFGENLKKNFIYDLIHLIPSMLNKPKYDELSEKSPLIAASYSLMENGFYGLNGVGKEHQSSLKLAFEKTGFSALNFTDSRGVFQFYSLSYLWNHIELQIKNELPLLHLAVEPTSACEVFSAVKGYDFVNKIAQVPPVYDFHTEYARLFSGESPYIFNKTKVLTDIVRFVQMQMNCIEKAKL